MGKKIYKSDGGKMNIAIGKHAVAEQTINHAVPQGVPVEDLLKLLAEIKAKLPELPAEAQAELRNEVEGAELQALARTSRTGRRLLPSWRLPRMY